LKALTLIALSLSFITPRAFADIGEINPDTARAYEGYILTFLWPEEQSIEHVDYENIFSILDIERLPEPDIKPEPSEAEAIPTEQASVQKELTPFDSFKEKLDSHVTVLANQKWTLIFKEPGDVITKAFHSNEIKDGYPELNANINIKLGRYLESDIHYKHYIFDSFSQPETAPDEAEESSSFFSPFVPTENDESIDLKAYEPALVLNLELSNKTASKKINYLDHPTIGTLLYFKPINLEEALEKMAMQSITPETGQSLNYDALQSTNELQPTAALIDSTTSDTSSTLIDSATLDTGSTTQPFSAPIIFE